MNLKRYIITKLGGFPSIEDAIDAIKERDLEERIIILTLAVKRLYNTISAEDILQEKNGAWLYEGKPLREDTKKSLIAEAQQLQGMKIWKVLQDDIRYQANKRMYLLAEKERDIEAGKLWQYTLDAINTRLNSLSKGSGFFHLK